MLGCCQRSPLGGEGEESEKPPGGEWEEGPSTCAPLNKDVAIEGGGLSWELREQRWWTLALGLRAEGALRTGFSAPEKWSAGYSEERGTGE